MEKLEQVNKTINEKIAEGREYRMMRSFEIRAEDEAQEPDFIVRGYASTFNEPYELGKGDGYTVREQVDPHAFDDCDMSDVIMQYDHQGRVFARTSNKTLDLAIDDTGLLMDRAYLGGTDIGRQLYQEIKGGYTTKMSFGFRVQEDKREVTENMETGEVDVLRTITKVSKLYDVSAVSLPANPGTSIESARALCDGLIAEAREEIRKAHEEREAEEQRKKRLRLQLELED